MKEELLQLLIFALLILRAFLAFSSRLSEGPPCKTLMADQESCVCITCAAKKRVAALANIDEQQQQPTLKKKVVLGELHNLSNVVLHLLVIVIVPLLLLHLMVYLKSFRPSFENAAKRHHL